MRKAFSVIVLLVFILQSTYSSFHHHTLVKFSSVKSASTTESVSFNENECAICQALVATKNITRAPNPPTLKLPIYKVTSVFSPAIVVSNNHKFAPLSARAPPSFLFLIS
jgi:hypothetical protein